MAENVMSKDVIDKFESEYCPPIDPSLLRSILSDYNDDTTDEARATLDVLKDSAAIEADQVDFDASGSAGFYDPLEHGSRTTESSPDGSAHHSVATDSTSLSNGIEGLNIGDSSDLDELDEDTKLQVLESLFGEKLPRHTIQHTLRSCQGRFHAAMEQLLNQVYFREAEGSEDGSRPSFHGIDAFSEDNLGRRSRKGKAKGKNRRSQNLSGVFNPGLQPADAPTNRWQSTADDIEFITSRTNLSTAVVSPIYHKQGASIPQTILAILNQSSKYISPKTLDAPLLHEHTQELEEEFPALSSIHAAALVRLTHPSTASAHELAKALTTTAHSASPTGGIQIIPMYTSASEIAHDSHAVAPASPRTLSSRGVGSVDAASRIGAYSARSHNAQMQASAAHRLAKSNPLMGGAAAYYAQVRREYSALAFAALADVADDTALTQSSAGKLDLHNIDVANAVRIARSRVEEWWAGLGESRVNGRVGAGERSKGFEIIVGKGIHSVGGKAKVGPAVAKMLREEGWRFESAGAVLLVKGRSGGR